MDLRRGQHGFMKECARCERRFKAIRKNAQLCENCRESVKSIQDMDRNSRIRDEKNKTKIPKDLNKKDLYEKFIDDIANAVVIKMALYFFVK